MTTNDIRMQIDELCDYIDTTIHPVVSPQNWNIYSKLRDLVDELKNTLEQNNVI